MLWLLFVIAFIGMSIMIVLTAPLSRDGLSGPASASVWGYGTMAISVLGLIFTMIGEGINKRINPQPSNNSISWAVFTAPAFLMLLVLIFITTMTSHYYIRINKGDVSKDYYKYSSLATFSICTQYLLLVYYILTENGTIVNDNKYPLVFLNYLFTICNLLIIIMLSIVANYFITDG